MRGINIDCTYYYILSKSCDHPDNFKKFMRFKIKRKCPKVEDLQIECPLQVKYFKPEQKKNGENL